MGVLWRCLHSRSPASLRFSSAQAGLEEWKRRPAGVSGIWDADMADGTDQVETGLGSLFRWDESRSELPAGRISCLFVFLSELSEGTVLRSLTLWTFWL